MSQSKIMKRLATNPKAQMDYMASGRMPRLREPLRTPLWELLNKIPPRDRIHIRGVKLSPELGYQSGQVFHTAEQLFRWLGGNERVGEWETPVSESRAIRSFRKKLTMEDLKRNCSHWPGHLDRKEAPKSSGFEP